MSRPDPLTALKNCPLLADLSEAHLETLLNYFDVMEGSKGDRLYTQGESNPGLYVVAWGTVWVRVADIDKRERNVTRIGAPGSFGELSLLLLGDRMVSVVAAEDVMLLELNIESFRRLKRTNPDLCLLLIMAIVRRLGRVLDDSRELLQRLLLRQFAGLDDG